jgi:hypothetical protein
MTKKNFSPEVTTCRQGVAGEYATTLAAAKPRVTVISSVFIIMQIAKGLAQPTGGAPSTEI